MKILIDTCIWSLALRRTGTESHPVVQELRRLIEDVRVQMIGPVRQEILSGIKSKDQFISLKGYLSAFPDLPLKKDDFVLAAEYYNICREKGLQGSNTDFLICAVSHTYHLPIFTCDQDFNYFTRCLPIHLYQPHAK